ncbi:unnamed protein product, partial [Brenthis ino]
MLRNLLLIVVINLLKVESLLVNLRKSCVPTQAVRGPCHTCICNEEGVFQCTYTKCEDKAPVHRNKSIKGECQPLMTYQYEDLICSCSFEGKWMSYNCRETFRNLKSNRTTSPNLRSGITFSDKPDEIPQIREGQSCIAGKIYKLACNTCQCGPNNVLLCTKMACLEKTIAKKIQNLKIDNSKPEPKRRIDVTKVPKKVKSFPKVPKTQCVPGRFYSKGCKKCLCNEKKVIVCTETCSSSVKNRINDQEISQLESRSAQDLPELTHVGKECVPGKSYIVSCNLCICNEKGGLICTVKYCLHINSYAKLQILKFTGTSCKEDYIDICVECKCVKSKSQCSPAKMCDINNVSEKQLLSSVGNKIKLSLDVKKENCIPNAIYKVHCNDCYCQNDGTLRCTQKVCLTYTQIKDLDARQTYLEKHGL